jgi:hypothetical protein
LLAALCCSPPAAGDDDVTIAPPDPLTPPATTTPSRGGYFGTDSAVSALQPPARLRVGDFALQASAAFTTAYDDNIEADDDDREEDIFFSLSPSVRAQSLYARHSLGFGASGTAATAVKNQAEDIFDWNIGADGRVDLSRRDKINAAIGYSRDTQDDEDVDAEDNQDDVPIHLIDASLGYVAGGDVIGYRFGGNVSRLDVEGSDFDDRDRTTLGLNASTFYRFSDRLSVSVGPSYSYATFDESEADDGDGRDSQSASFQIGGGYKVSRTINSSAAVGYSVLWFDDPDRETSDSAVGSLGLTWNAGAGTTLTLGASRTLNVTVVDDSDSRTTTTGSATLSHNLKLGARSAVSSSLGYSISEVSDLDRTDQNVSASLGYGYRLTEHAFFSAGYRFSRRDSDDKDADFYRNLISLGLSISY